MSGIPVLLITANVGSIFEEPATMLKLWTEEFLSTVSRLDPKFIALHCQEVGGKNYEQSMRHVEDFVRLLMSSEELRLFDKVSVFLDEDFSSAEHFTALGNFYFVHESLKDVLLWDFKECKFVPVSGKEVHSGNIEAVTTKEKAKFPQDFFPECKWSRKGFLRTRWSISGTVFDLINIHLFHDASNFIAMETFPSVYSKTRRRALEHTLERFHNDQYPNAPYFLFGDFNFRTDTAGVVKKLTEDTQESKLSNKGHLSKLQFRNKDDNLILTLGKKEFSHHDHRQVFTDDSGQWLREYDRELKDFEGRLFEFPIEFVPSYPFEEDIKQGTNYMQTRVPAWCDRILLSPTAKSLVQNISMPEAVEYGIIGQSTCMGDHKPVYLRAIVASDAGMVNCCSSPTFSQLCFQVPVHYRDRLSMLPGSNYVPLFTSDRSCCPSKLLHATPIVHDPYTPESMDSPSPSAIGATEIQECESTFILIPPTRKKPHAAVSPTLLKSKLELIVEIERQANQKRLQRDLGDHRHDPGLETDDQWLEHRRQRCYSDLSWMQRPWTSGNPSKLCRKYSLTSRPYSQTAQYPLIIPRIAIINPSNFQSNESSINLPDGDYTASLRRLSVRKDATSGEGSSLELDMSDERQTSEKIYSGAQDSGLDTLDVEDAFSRGGSLGLSSNETTSTLPLDNDDSQKRLDGDFENNRVLEANLDTALIKDKLISDNRHQISGSNDSTRSNSICGDDADASSEKEMRLKPCRVTHQYQKSIVNKHRCEKCCCVVS